MTNRFAVLMLVGVALTIGGATGLHWIVDVWNAPRRWLIGHWEGHEIRQWREKARVESCTLEFDASGDWVLILNDGKTRKCGQWRVMTSRYDRLTVGVDSALEGGGTKAEVVSIVFENPDTCTIRDPNKSGRRLYLRKRRD